MPVPKRRKSAAKSRTQRAANMKIDYQGLHSSCTNCGEPKASHRVCQSCGKYRDRQVIDVVQS